MDAVPHLSHASLIEHRAFVLRIARDLLADESSAQDVAQETLLVALRRPPAHHGGLRAWLARVVHSRVSDRRRDEARRASREVSTARDEAIEDGPSSQETLEIQHDVVGAVLALDEPYRAVVIQAYYDGLSPAEIARRRRMPPATVRLHLQRAHEMLRARLVREHGGDRRAWERSLLLFVERADRAGAPTAATAAIWPVLTTAAIVLALGTGATWYALDRRETTAQEPLSVPWTRIEEGAARVETGRVPLEPRSSAAIAVDESAPATEVAARPSLDELLMLSRQIKAEVSARRLAVPEADVDPRFLGRADAGVAILLDDQVYAHALDRPGANGSGTYYSFTRRVHDYDRDPQIGYFGGSLGVSLQGRGWILDLGERDPFALPTSGSVSAFPGDAARTIEWEAMFDAIDPSTASDRSPMDELYRLACERAVRAGRVRAEELSTPKPHGPQTTIEAHVGHTYLLRGYWHEHFDVIATVTVFRATTEECTIGWRILDSVPVPAAAARIAAETPIAELPPLPDPLRALDVAGLMAELARLRDLARVELFETFAAETSSRFGALRGRDDAGLVRLLSAHSEWGELAPEARFGCSHYSFLERDHAARTHDVLVTDDRAHGGYFVYPAGGGAIVDMGDVALESVTTENVGAWGGPAATFLAEFSFPDAIRSAQAGTLVNSKRSARLNKDVKPAHAAVEWLGTHAFELGAERRPIAVPGHTYVVRTISPGETDVLATFTVAQVDRFGVVLAWRALRAGRIPRLR